jgi:hypothetical protein
MMLGDFPPSSRVMFLRLDLAAACMITRPTRVDPVKATCDKLSSVEAHSLDEDERLTFSIFMCEAMAAPAMGPKPVRMLTTPGGKILAMRPATKKAERGVDSAVLMTMVFPVASAGPTFQATGGGEQVSK